MFSSSSVLSRKLARIFKGGRWHSSSTHNVVAKYWGNGGVLKWVEFLWSCGYFWNGAPTPYFIGQKR
jgi:hypothetical protein